MGAFDQQILEASAKFPKPADKTYQYGTAGFRMKSELLPSVVFRIGLLANLRSRKFGSQFIGVMITASHNPPADNGVKLVDPMGEMLESSWEAHATELCNAATDEDVVKVYNRLAKDLKISEEPPSHVVVGRDTRLSGASLLAAFTAGVRASTNTSVDNYLVDTGFATTPQLHYLVRCFNTAGFPYAYGEPTQEGYYKKLSEAFIRAMKHAKIKGSITVDCANGVGGPKLAELKKHLPAAKDGGIDIKIVNDDISRPEQLNVQCGADYVKTQQRAPPSSKAGSMERCCSLDGDADRIMYYYLDEDNQFQLLDGDRIATLAASFLGDLGKQSGLSEHLKIGIVQTAYANGASTEYVEKTLGLPISCTATGVKHLHHAAMRFDIGVYFEANGHGTVLFSPSAIKVIEKHEPKSPAQATALETLRAVSDLINQTVGDALSDMLLVEVILAHKNWSPKEWASTYKDLPNRLVKVEIPDRSIFKTVDAERRLESPPGIQAEIDDMVGRYKQGRSFARASGTEDAVRVYAEASTTAEALDLAMKVKSLVENYGRN